VSAIEQAIYEGINVNVTLLFAVSAYERVAEAFLRGVERRQADRKPLDVHSVASFFVSRADTNVDRKLDELGRDDLHGRAALANARAAYRRFKEIFAGPRWEGLHRAGAAVQRPLWASTGVKNPNYPDTMYVDELVGRDIVNTMPMATLHAVADHSTVTGPTAEHDPAPDLQAVAEAGIDIDQVTDELLIDGVKQFEDAMDRLLAGIDERRVAVATGRPPTIQEAKDNTKRVLDSGSVPSLEEAGDDELRALLADARPPHYVAIMGYLPPSEELDDAVAELHEAVRAATGAATTFGYGPRFLHSTGQLHKGGPPKGPFLQLVSDPQRDAEIPGAGYSFGTLIAAQAAGDLQTLREHDLPAERVKLEGEPAAAVRALSERVTGLLSGSRRTP
jgi:transaldolase / glucose-6-phosphate isomerase